MPQRSSSEGLMQALQQMADLKDEHQPLLARIAADAGMAPDTRVALIEHVLAEEKEHLQRILMLAGDKNLTPHVAAAKPASVGSLRVASSVSWGGTSRPEKAKP